ncbi:EEF1A lysine methyltransferase 3 isoform X2 [Carica papaya]|uniref:EEF1A lysine methyltransferase 3 isoform X2 n=1 Tax=Carica papaya TaxID=3649 RepID=UPI000B8C7265|nr:EEF1A lysine methyltransferase 3 isoform X2 [Carica papaya]
MDIALFSPSSLFAGDDDDSSADEQTTETSLSYVERRHQFPGMELIIQEFSFHQLNANLLWPGTFAFAEWLVQNPSCIKGRRCIELGSGTGALAIFLRKSFDLDITTSDYDDQEIEENIAHNCSKSNIIFLTDSWGDTFPIADPDWDLVVASDILLYVKQYTNLTKSLSFLLKAYKPSDNKSFIVVIILSFNLSGIWMNLPKPAFLMSWRRRIGKEDESLFFAGCEKAGLEVKHIGSRVYCINLIESKST